MFVLLETIVGALLAAPKTPLELPSAAASEHEILEFQPRFPIIVVHERKCSHPRPKKESVRQ